MGLRWVMSRPVETLLLVFGIALGIGATAAGLALAAQAGNDARETLSSTGFREIVVTSREDAEQMELPAVAKSESGDVLLTSADLAAREDAPDVQYAYIRNPLFLRLGSAPGGGPGMGSVQRVESDSSAGADKPEGLEPVLEELRGYEVTPEFFDAWNLAPAEGSLFALEDLQGAEPLLVLGSSIGGKLFEDGESLGRQVLARRRLYRVAGVLEPTGTSFDDMVFTQAVMPDLMGLAGTVAVMRFSRNATLHFTVADYERLSEAQEQLSSWFEQQHGAGTVVLSVPRYEAEEAQDRLSRLVTVILFLALSALLIAAANVTNILASRAMRRRRSVGILKALGATVHGVFRLFFLEAAIVGLAGALVGTGLSVLMSLLMEDTMGFGGLYAPLLGAGIVGATVLVTALDVVPAMQAARVPAAEAIRYE